MKHDTHQYFLPLMAAISLVSGALSSGNAATLVAPASGDLILGFRASGGTGSSTSLLINIGNDLNYRNAAFGSSFDVLGLGNIGADLTAAFGANWSSRADLYWGIVGTRAGVNSTVYASREQSPAGTPSTPWSTLTQTARNATATSITDVLSGIGGYTGSDSTANSTVAFLQPNSGFTSSYNFQVATQGTTDFGSLSQWNSIEGSFAGGPNGSALDLYRLSSGGVSSVGTFTIGSTGTLNFTAVPEPGATLLLGAAGMVILLRRRIPATAA